MALELQLPKECSTHASYWRSFFHSFPLPAGTSAPKMVTSLCPSSSVWFIMWTIPPHSIFLSGNACFYGGVISLVGTLQVQPSLSPLRCALPLHGLVSSSIIDASNLASLPSFLFCNWNRGTVCYFRIREVLLERVI